MAVSRNNLVSAVGAAIEAGEWGGSARFVNYVKGVAIPRCEELSVLVKSHIRVCTFPWAMRCPTAKVTDRPARVMLATSREMGHLYQSGTGAFSGHTFALDFGCRVCYGGTAQVPHRTSPKSEFLRPPCPRAAFEIQGNYSTKSEGFVHT